MGPTPSSFWTSLSSLFLDIPILSFFWTSLSSLFFWTSLSSLFLDIPILTFFGHPLPPCFCSSFLYHPTSVYFIFLNSSIVFPAHFLLLFFSFLLFSFLLFPFSYSLSLTPLVTFIFRYLARWEWTLLLPPSVPWQGAKRRRGGRRGKRKRRSGA